MKSIQEKIAVDARNRVPRRLRWENRTYRVRRLLDYWILQTRWWGREEKRIYFRLETNRGIVEVYRATESLLPGLASTASGLAPTASGLASTASGTASNASGFSPNGLTSTVCEPRPAALALLPTEGDTHTRERRRTDAAYRPDVRIEDNLRRKARATDRDRPERVRWVLSKIID